MLAGWVARVPHRVHTVAGLPLTEATGLKRWLLIEIEKVTLWCATNVLVNSTQLSEFMIETGLCDTSKLKVLGHGSSNGIDTDFFFATSELRAKAKTIRQSLGIPAESLMFCFVGRMVADKGLDELISAFVSISKECSAYLLLVGPFEEDLDPLTSESRRLILNHEKIVHVGFQSDIRPYLTASTVLVHPSYREGFPNVVMQAGSMGLPCIVSNINGCNEIVMDGHNGIIVEPKDPVGLENAMRLMVKDDGLRQRLASSAREMIVSRYDQREFWESLLQFYQKLMVD